MRRWGQLANGAPQPTLVPFNLQLASTLEGGVVPLGNPIAPHVTVRFEVKRLRRRFYLCQDTWPLFPPAYSPASTISRGYRCKASAGEHTAFLKTPGHCFQQCTVAWIPINALLLSCLLRPSP